jgi:hypothetical protein
MVGFGSLTSRDAEQVAQETRDLVQSRDLVSLAVTGLSAAGGVVVAQEISDRVLEMANLNVDPVNATDYAGAVVTKGVVASAFAFAAANLSGLGLVATGFMALGALASAGADLLEGLLTTAPFGGGTSGSMLANASAAASNATSASSTSKNVTVDATQSTSPSASSNGTADAAF